MWSNCYPILMFLPFQSGDIQLTSLHRLKSMFKNLQGRNVISGMQCTALILVLLEQRGGHVDCFIVTGCIEGWQPLKHPVMVRQSVWWSFHFDDYMKLHIVFYITYWWVSAKRRNFITNVPELRLSWTNPSVCSAKRVCDILQLMCVVSKLSFLIEIHLI